MVTLQEILAFLEKLAPKELAEYYDNVGLLIGDETAEISNVLLSLDTDRFVAEEAAGQGADLIISHHPLIFKPLKNIVLQDPYGRIIYSLVKHDICLYALHTNFDSVNGGLCDYLLSRICGGTTVGTFTGEGADGIGRLLELGEPMPLHAFLGKIRAALGIRHIKFVGDENRKIRTVGICNGGGAEFIYDAKKYGADVYVSGDFKYHHARFAYENDMALVEISHYDAEILFCEYMKQLLAEQFGGRLNITISSANPDVWQVFGE